MFTILSAGISPFYIVVAVLSALFLPVMIWMIFTSIKVNTTYNRYARVAAQSGMTAGQAARAILNSRGLDVVDIRLCAGKLTDHYDPRDNTVYLSEATYNSTSIAAIGVAAHEVGHALQYAEEYKPVKIRTALVPVVNFTSRLTFPLILIAIVLEALAYAMNWSLTISNLFLALALLCYFVYALFTLITLPTEFNASSRAKQILAEENILSEQELQGTSKVLRAAAMTYVASFVMSLVQVARILLILLSRRSRN